MASNGEAREHWGTRIGLVLAMAGNAIGLGNFLRFPGQAAANGGGAFLIPYFICLLLMAIPLMWLEWTQGRYGGVRGHGTTPAMFQLMWKHPIAKYLGVLGLFIPTIILFYYSYIGSWTLGYSIKTLLGQTPHVSQAQLHEGMTEEEISQTVLQPYNDFLGRYSGDTGSGYLLQPDAFTLAIFTFVYFLTLWLMARGVSGGIEVLAKVAMPLLFLLAIALVVRVFTLGHPVSPDYGVMEGIAFLWEPKWFVERDGKEVFVLLDSKTWLAAAGQVFFSLSLGMGAIQCYASYLRRKDDVTLTGLSTTASNSFAEVVLGASIALPAASAFFGVAAAQMIAAKGSFYLGFVSMPAIFSFLPAGSILGFLWFLLLFFAALTSVVAMCQPVIAFLEDEFGMSRKRAVAVMGLIWLVGVQFAIWIKGGIDVYDFWSSTFGPPLMALIEVVILMWIFGGEKVWQEMHEGALLRVPRFFYYCAKYITPLFLMAILGTWFYENVIHAFITGELFTRPIEAAGLQVGWHVWAVRGFVILVFLAQLFAIWYAWNVRKSMQRAEVLPE
ncbi:MAG: sodium-dependent transporter [Armatimonadota bacterium]|nr:sodium-dependent transporter [bacterium]MCS7310172.1 sodium-dependent transporter [Armatimonadota bacterium]MDW8290566.1 sodium-dependent transporter [Armatimonadota bacterium]